MTALTVVIVAYRCADVLDVCLRSVLREVSDAHVVVVDNNGEKPTEDVCHEVQMAGLQLTYIPSRNVGYARAVELAVNGSIDAPYLLVLNPDVELLASPLSLIGLLDQADIVAGTLIRSRGDVPRHYPNARPRISLAKEVLRTVVGPRAYRGPRYSTLVPWQRVDQLDGAYMLMRTSWYRLHRFDVSYELYYEDVDLCDRARQGQGCVVSSTVAGLHLGGVSSSQSEISYVLNRVSRARYCAKRFSRNLTPVWAALFILEAFSRTISFRRESLMIRVKAVRAAVRELYAPMSVTLLDTPAG